MVPAAWVVLDTLPLTANGKLDRRRLPSAEGSSEAPEAGSLAPRTDLERELAAIWAKVLGVPAVGVDDNFLALGGHSITATQILSRVRDAFSVELPFRTLFENPTVAGLAERLVAALAEV